MVNKKNEVELGENITHLAKGTGAKSTAVISVRLSIEEVTRLEALAAQTGRSMSDIARDALSNYVPPEPEGIMRLSVAWEGISVRVGSQNSTGSTPVSPEAVEELIQIG